MVAAVSKNVCLWSVLVTLALAGPTAAHGQTILLERDVTGGPAPGILAPHSGSSAAEARYFDESGRVPIIVPMDVRSPGSYRPSSMSLLCRDGATGDVPAIHHLVLHPDSAATRRVVAMVPGVIRGLEVTGDCLNRGDLELGRPRFTTYPSEPTPARGLEVGPGDVVTLLEGRQAVAFELAVDPGDEGEDWDDARIIIDEIPVVDPSFDLAIFCEVTADSPSSVDIEAVVSVRGSATEQFSSVVVLPPGVAPELPLPTECMYYPVHDLVHCFGAATLGIGDHLNTLGLTGDLEGKAVAVGIVSHQGEADYDNNGCGVRLTTTSPDAGLPSDAGPTTDAGPLLDAGDGDAASPRDASRDTGEGADSTGGPAGTAAFRGSGGCTCGIASRADGGIPLSALALLLIIGWRAKSR